MGTLRSADHCGDALTDHDGRDVRVAARDVGHDRGIDHTESLEAVNPSLREI